MVLEERALLGDARARGAQQAAGVVALHVEQHARRRARGVQVVRALQDGARVGERAHHQRVPRRQALVVGRGAHAPLAHLQQARADPLAHLGLGLRSARLQHVGPRRPVGEVAGVRRAEPAERGVGVRAECADELGGRPDVEASLLALGVRVERAVEPAVRRPHLAQRPVERLLARAPQHRIPADEPAVQVRAGEQGVVVQHLLEVRDRPRAVDAVPREAAAHLVVDAARGHRAQRLRAPSSGSPRASRNSMTLAAGNFGPRRAAPAAVHAVEARRERRRRPARALGAERVGRRPQPGAARQPRRPRRRRRRRSRRGARASPRRRRAAPAARTACRGAARGGK